MGARYDNRVLNLTLPDGYIVLIDEADQLLIAGFPWRVLQAGAGGLMYAHAWNGKMHLYMHRLIAGAGPEEHVDHWDLNGLNNQKHNLRIPSRGQNQANRGKQFSRNGRLPTSQYKGVYWDKSRSRWSAYIGSRGQRRYLGRFTDEELAARAYDEAAVAAWGQFARLNFPVDNGLVCGRHRLAITDAPCTCGNIA